MSNSRHDKELQAEREYTAFLYQRLDAERTTAAAALDGALRDSALTGTESRWQREVSVDTLTARVSRLRVADNGLCFGRIEDEQNGRSYIGRIGLFDDSDDYESLLVDWRAPAARAFYTATAANPEGLTSRRHFHTRGRGLVDFHDEVLDLSVAAADRDADSVLLAAVNAPRGDTMRDIVATIQAEQDQIIRLGHSGVVVIEGGPGTGKTAVALHRVAYLLYTQRERLSRRGVLIVGPNPGFLRYISRVLPSLGETDIVFATPGELMPGVRTTAQDAPETARVKGSMAMVDVLAAAVSDRQRLPEQPIMIALDDVTLSVDADLVGPARELARATDEDTRNPLLHNEGRLVFRKAMFAALAQQAVQQIGADWMGPEDPAELAAQLTAEVRTELLASPAVHAALEELWPLLTPQTFLADLLSSRERLDAAGATLTEAERAALWRADGAAWTVSDVPLLDEAAELLGKNSAIDQRAEQAKREQVEYARGVLQILDNDGDPDGELLRAVDVLDPELLSERHEERDHRYLAERAAADREWIYGHIVVDEAQELSEMDWRVLMRRCPSKSITVVGDLAQRQSAAGAGSWGAMLDRYVPGRWTYRELTINYRTPAEIMEIATQVLAEVNPELRPPESVRSNGIRPWASLVLPDQLAAAVAAAVQRETARAEGGSVAVIAPEGTVLDLPVPVLSPRGAKGLEFDAVVIVEPQQILAEQPHGAGELYVCLTRATQRLAVLHTAPLPAPLHGLAAP